MLWRFIRDDPKSDREGRVLSVRKVGNESSDRCVSGGKCCRNRSARNCRGGKAKCRDPRLTAARGRLLRWGRMLRRLGEEREKKDNSRWWEGVVGGAERLLGCREEKVRKRGWRAGGYYLMFIKEGSDLRIDLSIALPALGWSQVPFTLITLFDVWWAWKLSSFPPCRSGSYSRSHSSYCGVCHTQSLPICRWSGLARTAPHHNWSDTLPQTADRKPYSSSEISELPPRPEGDGLVSLVSKHKLKQQVTARPYVRSNESINRTGSLALPT